MTSGGQVERLLWAAAEARRLRARDGGVGGPRPQAVGVAGVDEFVTEWQVEVPSPHVAPKPRPDQRAAPVS